MIKWIYITLLIELATILKSYMDGFTSFKLPEQVKNRALETEILLFTVQAFHSTSSVGKLAIILALYGICVTVPQILIN